MDKRDEKNLNAREKRTPMAGVADKSRVTAPASGHKSKSVGDLEALQRLLRGLMPELQARYGVKSLGVFGSFANGRHKKRSDVDLLVEFDGHVPVTLLKFVALERELGKAIGHKVDLVERDTLKSVIGKRILEEVKPV